MRQKEGRNKYRKEQIRSGGKEQRKRGKGEKGEERKEEGMRRGGKERKKTKRCCAAILLYDVESREKKR